MNKLKDHMVYVAGPMEETTDRGRGWRDYVEAELNKRNIITLSPLNKPFLGAEYSEDEAFVVERNRLVQNQDADALAELMRVHVCRPDLSLVDKADFLIAYIDKNIFMCGTIWELCVAANQRKPVLVVCKQGRFGVPFWLWGVLPHKVFFNNWDEMFAHIDEIDSGNVIPSKYWRFFNMNKIFRRDTIINDTTNSKEGDSN